MFNRCGNFKGKGLENWNVSNVKTMEFMFVGCEKFDGDLSGWDVSNVKYMNSMFYACINFTGKGLENWKLNKYANIDYIFNGCDKMKNKPSWYKK